MPSATREGKAGPARPPWAASLLARLVAGRGSLGTHVALDTAGGARFRLGLLVARPRLDPPWQAATRRRGGHGPRARRAGTWARIGDALRLFTVLHKPVAPGKVLLQSQAWHLLAARLSGETLPIMMLRLRTLESLIEL